MKSLQEKLIAPLLLDLSRLNGKYTVDTDDFDKIVVCVLLQEPLEGPNWPIGYWSRSVHIAERSYDTKNLESLDVVWDTLLLRHYLHSTRSKIRTDHDACPLILNISD